MHFVNTCWVRVGRAGDGRLELWPWLGRWGAPKYFLLSWLLPHTYFFNLGNNSARQVSSMPFYTWGNWGSIRELICFAWGHLTSEWRAGILTSPPEFIFHVEGTPIKHWLAWSIQRHQLSGQKLHSRPTRACISPSRSAVSGSMWNSALIHNSPVLSI